MKSKLLMTIITLVFTGLSFFFVFYGKIWTDEYWYYCGSVLVSQGKNLHFDFFSHHNPIYFVLYAIPQFFFGPSLLIGRLTSFVLTLLIFLVIVNTAYKLSGQKAALIAIACFATNHFALRYFVTCTYHALESLLIVLFFFSITILKKAKFRCTFGTIFLSLIIGTRYIIDISLVFLFLYFIYLYLSKNCSNKLFMCQVIVAAILIGSFIFPYIPVFEKWFFQVIQYPVCGTVGSKGAMLINNEIASILFYRLAILEKIISNFWVVLIPVLSISIGLGWLIFKDRNKIVLLWKNNTILFMIIIFIILTELFYQIPLNSWPATRLFYFPAACISTGIIYEKFADSIQNSTAKNVWIALPIVIIAFSLVTQEIPHIRSSWKTAHLNYLDQIKKLLQQISPSDAELFTFSPHLVIESNRAVSLNMFMETWQIHPKMPTSECKKYGLVNIKMILNELNNKRPFALVLKNPGRLEDNAGKGRILIPYRKVIWNAIHNNYSLNHTINMKKEVDGVVNIYFKK
jgi:4-amino-4-deoxy-L-arabinose transferase-like glycosyltransferase